MTANAIKNRSLLHYIVLPTAMLTAVLLGGLRVDSETHQFLFISPPLVTLVLAVLLVGLFIRARALEWHRWISIDQPVLTNVSNFLILLTLFFASAQAFNSVLPENGLLHWMFCFFFLWTLWTNQFSVFDTRRLMKSLIVLFATAFVLKHLLVSGLYSAKGGLFSRIASTLLQGIAIEDPGFAPATGYISFFALAFYIAGLLMVSSPPEPASSLEVVPESTNQSIQVRDTDETLDRIPL